MSFRSLCTTGLLSQNTQNTQETGWQDDQISVRSQEWGLLSFHFGVRVVFKLLYCVDSFWQANSSLDRRLHTRSVFVIVLTIGLRDSQVCSISALYFKRPF